MNFLIKIKTIIENIVNHPLFWAIISSVSIFGCIVTILILCLKHLQ